VGCFAVARLTQALDGHSICTTESRRLESLVWVQNQPSLRPTPKYLPAGKKAILPIGKRNPITCVWRLWNKSGVNITNGDTVLNQDFKEFIQSLNDNQVRYLVIGGYAVAFHGHPRYTQDMDIWLAMIPENASKMIKALEQFGFGTLGLKADDFLVPDQIIQLGYAPSRIDLLTTLKGVEFEKCYASRVEVEIEGVKVNFIDLENLKQNKKATGRHQDLADLENLE
jgi:predicted nucleotidyltransferase